MLAGQPQIPVRCEITFRTGADGNGAQGASFRPVSALQLLYHVMRQKSIRPKDLKNPKMLENPLKTRENKS